MLTWNVTVGATFAVLFALPSGEAVPAHEAVSSIVAFVCIQLLSHNLNDDFSVDHITPCREPKDELWV